MSFGINGPSPKFGIQEAQNMRNNGGGGNLGYFKRGKKKDEQKDKKNNKDETDVFQSSLDESDILLPEDDIKIDKTAKETLLDKASEFINMFKTKRHGA